LGKDNLAGTIEEETLQVCESSIRKLGNSILKPIKGAGGGGVSLNRKEPNPQYALLIDFQRVK